MLLLTAARRALAIAVLALVPAVPAQAATATWTGLTFTTTSMELGSSLKATAAVGSSTSRAWTRSGTRIPRIRPSGITGAATTASVTPSATSIEYGASVTAGPR